MNVKQKIRQMGALLTGATMVGATIMGAAADLSMYPEPFVQDGVLNALIVVGANAKTSDTLGAIDIAASLQAAASSPAGGTAGIGRVNIQGDAAEIGEPSDLLEVEELIGDVKEVITESHLKALSTGTITTDQGTTEYAQYLRFEGDIAFNTSDDRSVESCLVGFRENEDEEVGDFLVCKDGWTVFEYEMEFEEGLESDVKSSGGELHLDDMEDESLNIFGTDYTIVKAIANGTGGQSGGAGDSNFSMHLQMLGGDVVDTLGEGETRTYTIDGVDYEVTAIFISDGGSTDAESAKFSVNGDITDELEDGETDVLPGGLEIGVREVLTNQREGIVEFFLGANKVELTDNDCQDDEFTSNVEIAEENIEDARVRFKCAYVTGSSNGVTAGDTLEITDVRYQMDADASDGSTVYVPPGHGVREFLDEPQGMLNPTWDLRYEGLMDTGTAEWRIAPNGDDEYRLVFNSRESLEYDVPLLTNEGGIFKYGDDDDDLIFEEACFNTSWHSTSSQPPSPTAPNYTGCYLIDEDDFFVLTDDNDETGFTHVMRFESIDISNNVVTFNDLATGNKEMTYSGTEITLGNAAGSLTVGGKTYKVWVYDNNTTRHLAVDLNNDGVFSVGNKSDVVVNGGGILDLGTARNLTGPLNWTKGAVPGSDRNLTFNTTASEFDESGANNSGSPESINITISSRTGNEIGLAVSARPFAVFSSPRTNSDLDEALTTYGAYMEILDESGSDEAESFLMKYPLSQRGAQVFVTAGTVRTSKGVGGGAVTVNPAAVGIGVLDTEVTLGRGNLISVGGPCANDISAELMGNPTDCAEDFTPGKAVIKLYDDKNALLVAGYSAQDTLGAAYVLADYEDYDLSGMEVEVVVADLDSITVNKVA